MQSSHDIVDRKTQYPHLCISCSFCFSLRIEETVVQAPIASLSSVHKRRRNPPPISTSLRPGSQGARKAPRTREHATHQGKRLRGGRRAGIPGLCSPKAAGGGPRRLSRARPLPPGDTPSLLQPPPLPPPPLESPRVFPRISPDLDPQQLDARGPGALRGDRGQPHRRARAALLSPPSLRPPARPLAREARRPPRADGRRRSTGRLPPQGSRPNPPPPRHPRPSGHPPLHHSTFWKRRASLRAACSSGASSRASTESSCSSRGESGRNLSSSARAAHAARISGSAELLRVP